MGQNKPKSPKKNFSDCSRGTAYKIFHWWIFLCRFRAKNSGTTSSFPGFLFLIFISSHFSSLRDDTKSIKNREINYISQLFHWKVNRSLNFPYSSQQPREFFALRFFRIIEMASIGGSGPIISIVIKRTSLK